MSEGFSAAELQKRHGLEGAPDPFPSLGGGSAAPAAATTSYGPARTANANTASDNAPVDTSSETAFPSLGGGGPAASSASKPVSAWSSGVNKRSAAPAASAPGGLGRSGPPLASSLAANASFSVPSANITLPAKQFSELLKKINETTGCMVEASTQMRTGLKTFFVRGPDDKKVAQARRMIERGVSKTETKGCDIPLNLLGIIIGPKGSTLKSVTDATGTKIDIPRRDQLPSATEKPRNGSAEDQDDEEDDGDDLGPPVTVSITGPTPAIADAQARLHALIKDRISQASIKITDIPSEFYPFIAGPKGSKARQLESTIGQGQVQVHVPPPGVWKNLEKQAQADESEEQGIVLNASKKDAAAPGDRKRDVAIRVKGDKDLVAAVVNEIRRIYEDARDNARTMTISIPKRQHRFLVGAAADEILEQHGCIVELPSVEDPSDACTIRGPQRSLAPALALVMDKANAVGVETIDVVAIHRASTSDALGHAKNLVRYLIRKGKFRVSDAQSKNVKVFPPNSQYIDATGNVVIEIVGEDRAGVSAVKDQILNLVKSTTPAHIQPVEVDMALHAFLIGKKGAKIAQFESSHNVATVFPNPSEESSEVLLVSTLEGLPADKKQRDAKLRDSLSAAVAGMKSLAKEAADVKTVSLDVDQKFHRAVVGPQGSVLKSLLGEDPIAIITVGNKDAKSPQNTITIRGPSTEVDRLVPLVEKIVEDAKNDDIVNGHVREFTVDKKHVPHLVGASGAAINKLRESLSVRINFDDEAEGNVKKTKTGAQVRCKIVGRKEAVEEAERRLQAQIEKLEDETTEVVNIKRQHHAALIGASGKYAIRLEDKYGVKITFPKDVKEGETKSTQKPDEVIIRGGKKGVASAKAELLEAAEFEKESNQESSFTVPTNAVARILGKGGASINAIKVESGAQIDVDKTSDEKTTVTVRGDKKSIAAAKAAIQAIVADFGDRIEKTIEIDNKFHRQLIGPGGQRLREVIVRCGGPDDSAKQAGMINFPRSSDGASNEVRLRGEKAIVEKIAADLLRQVESLQNQVVLGVRVPVAAHATRIGRGGSALTDLQKKTGATIQFPGSRQYASAGAIENAAELGDAPEQEIVKVIGSREACAQAIEVLSQPVSTPATRSQTPTANGAGGRGGNSDWPTRSISVPNKYYHAVVDQGQLQRNLRQAGVQVEIPPASSVPARPNPATLASGSKPTAGATSARIDADADGEGAGDDLDYTFETYEAYAGLGEEGVKEQTFVLRGREEVLAKGEQILQAALEKAQAASTIGVLSGIPRSSFPRIIGSKGATISRMRAETGTEIQVGKEDELITIIGDAQSVEFAKDAILSIVTRQGKRF